MYKLRGITYFYVFECSKKCESFLSNKDYKRAFSCILCSSEELLRSYVEGSELVSLQSSDGELLAILSLPLRVVVGLGLLPGFSFGISLNEQEALSIYRKLGNFLCVGL